MQSNGIIEGERSFATEVENHSPYTHTQYPLPPDPTPALSFINLAVPTEILLEPFSDKNPIRLG